MKKTKAAIIVNGIWQFIDFVLGIPLTAFFGLLMILLVTDVAHSDDPVVIGIFLSIFIVLGINFIVRGNKRRKLGKAFKSYVQVLAGDPYNSLDTIAEATNTPVDVVKKNVQTMIKKHFFADARIDPSTNSIVLNGKVNPVKILEDKANAPIPVEKNRNAPTDFVNEEIITPVRNTNEMMTVKCKGCGAISSVALGQVVECEYCGNMVKGE